MYRNRLQNLVSVHVIGFEIKYITDSAQRCKTIDKETNNLWGKGFQKDDPEIALDQIK